MASRKTDTADETTAPAGESAKSGKVAVVKKYANRRLYNTASSSYVTLDELCQMVREGHEFVVYDAKTGDDITRSVLTQIILEEDAKGRNLLPIGFLRQLIGFYDDSLNALVPRYLEVSMENFARHQEQMRSYVEETVGRFFPLKQLEAMNPFEEVARQNIALFQKAASMFTPGVEASGPDKAESEPADERDDGKLDRELQALRSEMAALQRQMRAMRRTPAEPED